MLIPPKKELKTKAELLNSSIPTFPSSDPTFEKRSYLHELVARGSFDEIKACLALNANTEVDGSVLNDQTYCPQKGEESEANTALLLAIKIGRPDVALLLLNEAAIDIEVLDQHGMSALHWACFFRYDDVIKRLLEKKATIQPAVSDSVYSGWTPNDFYQHSFEDTTRIKPQLNAHADDDQPLQPLTQIVMRYFPAIMSYEPYLATNLCGVSKAYFYHHDKQRFVGQWSMQRYCTDFADMAEKNSVLLQPLILAKRANIAINPALCDELRHQSDQNLVNTSDSAVGEFKQHVDDINKLMRIYEILLKPLTSVKKNSTQQPLQLGWAGSKSVLIINDQKVFVPRSYQLALDELQRFFAASESPLFAERVEAAKVALRNIAAHMPSPAAAATCGHGIFAFMMKIFGCHRSRETRQVYADILTVIEGNHKPQRVCSAKNAFV